jgi:hypothetical protein
MNETCDRCGPLVRAAYRVDGDGELYLCGHCTDRLWNALCAQGWNIWPMMEPVSGFEPLACRLQEVRPRATRALTARMTRVIALMALAALGLSGAPSHEPFHARGPYVPSSHYCV